MKSQLLGALLALVITAPAFAAIKEMPLTYNDGETTMKGFVVYDTAKKGKRPGIVMVHEWWGITKHMHDEAQRLARQGYTAFIAGVVGFHASLGLNTPAPVPGAVKAKILVLNGADDPFVKKEEYATLKADMDAARADYRVIEYSGAVHAFTNPEATALGKKFNLPLRYDAKVNKEAEGEASRFFADAFRQ